MFYRYLSRSNENGTAYSDNRFGLCTRIVWRSCIFDSAVNPESAAEALYRVATDKQIAKRLIEKGKEQLKTYDNYEERARKLVNILEEITI